MSFYSVFLIICLAGVEKRAAFLYIPVEWTYIHLRVLLCAFHETLKTLLMVLPFSRGPLSDPSTQLNLLPLPRESRIRCSGWMSRKHQDNVKSGEMDG